MLKRNFLIIIEISQACTFNNNNIQGISSFTLKKYFRLFNILKNIKANFAFVFVKKIENQGVKKSVQVLNYI